MVRCSTTPRIFSVFLSPLSSSAAPLLCPRYRPSYPTRGCANYIGGRESASRPTIEIACRLSVWPLQPFPPLFSFSFSARYILFPPARAFPPVTTNNISTRRRRCVATTTKSSAKLLSPPGDPATAPSSCPRSRDDYCTSGERARLRRQRQRRQPTAPLPPFSWKT